MLNIQTKAKIFPAEERGCIENSCFRRLSTFNFNQYFNPHKQPFNHIYGFNDDTIAAGKCMSIEISEPSCFLLLPVVGSLVYKINDGNENILQVANLQVIHFTRPASIEFFNCYENELINFIQVGIKVDHSRSKEVSGLFSFNLDENKNRLISITGLAVSEEKNLVVSIGNFAGRHEAIYNIKEDSTLFVFVITGVFEVQGRLLRPGDGLALWNSRDIEMEALNNDGIIFMIEG